MRREAPTSVVLRGMQIKTTVRSRCAPPRTAAIKKHDDKDEDKLEPLYVAGGNATWYRCYEKKFGSSSKKSNIVIIRPSNSTL